ncbi:hypothetical protein KJ909_02375 [Patescibacteria group bacterium]|nr:hypothetical protein [Patescibacteria group bacterium]
MTSLTRVAYVSRKIIKYGGGGLLIFVIFWSIATGAIRAYRAKNPAIEAPTVRYGLLPKTAFPEKEFSKKEFRQELANDAFPQFASQTKIYVIYRPSRDFLALEEDKKVAASLGFIEEPKQIKYGVYEFENRNLRQTLTMNVLEGSFVLKYPYLDDQTLLAPGKVPNKNEAIAIASGYLETSGKLDEKLKEGEKKVEYWRIDYDGLKVASSLSEANVARVDFFRKNLDDLPIVGIQVNRAPVSVLVSGSEVASKKVVEVNYKSVMIDEESYSTYPIKPIEEAWKDLQSGNYWPASDSQEKTVAIRNVYLAYFEPVVLTNFLQPIFVFEGSDNFVAYVTAVTDSQIE